jgi:hypothetical protein
MISRGWPIVSVVLGLVIVLNTLNVSGNLADALAEQPPLGDDSTAQLITLLAAGGLLVVGGLTALVVGLVPQRNNSTGPNSLPSE